MRCISLAVIILCSMQIQAQGLKDAYREYFMMGVAVNTRNIYNSEETKVILDNFQSITAENCMKPGEIHPAEGVWNWAQADSLANFCRRNGLKLRGHNLCWHSQFAEWMFTDKNGKTVSKEVFYQRLRNHIHTLINRYKDIVYCWDVVNEAMSDEGLNPYRDSRLYKLCGDEFIAKAFEYAHEADPKAILFYNDYNTFQSRKCQNICNMVQKMQQAGVPITGIGMQGHYNIYGPNMAEVDSAITKYSKLVQHIHITELDIRVTQDMGGQLQFSRQSVEVSEQVKALQNDQYSHLFDVLRKHRDVVECVTFWNLSDRDSWLGANNYPLLWDKNLAPKRSYFTVRDFRNK